ncbi:phosphotransferase family protein [Yinghuangia sp. YIM S09857]|uniref:phosphotransferase family protein n=1 Tax=Yinghuangia sp. YIM S09857 TaxID=3436929 RepID=UPI003F52DCB7
MLSTHSAAEAGTGTGTGTEAAGLRDRLRAWLADETGDPHAAVSLPARTTMGFSRENWFFDASWTTTGGRREVRLVARRDPAGSVLDSDRTVEAALLRALHGTRAPVPALHWADLTGVRAGRPTLVMDRMPGDCRPFILAGPQPEDERVALAGRFCDELAAIHGLDTTASGIADVLPDPGAGAAHAAVDHWEAELRKAQLGPEPELEYVLAWLRTTAPPGSGPNVLVHGDFKPGNLLIRDGRVTAVLDWETAHLGDPLEDVGWVTNPLRAREHLVPGRWEREELIAGWERRTGRVADRRAVRWWNVLANLKLTVLVLAGQKALLDGRYDRITQTPVTLTKLLFELIRTYERERRGHGKGASA